jgi:cyanophycinase-like exopeptidase
MDWLPVVDAPLDDVGTTLSDSALHGSVTVYDNGGIAFTPDPLDPYWYPAASDPEPEAIEFQYQITDGIDSNWHYVTITHGFYQRGGPIDSLHTGSPMYLLAGGGDSAPFDEGRSAFFQEGSRGGDIVLIAQGTEQKDFVDTVFDYYAGGLSRSVTSLNITTREQALDPRLSRVVQGADALWFGGGAQSFYQSSWTATTLFQAFVQAAASPVAIGGTSAGMAILGAAAYVDLPWDSVQSAFAPQNMLSPRVNVVSQAWGALPFATLSNSPLAALSGFVTDTHFSDRDRMGRAIAFAARSNTRVLAVDSETALLIRRSGFLDWNWSVYGNGHVYVVGQSRPDLRGLTGSIDAAGRLSTGVLSVVRLDPLGAAGATTRTKIFYAAATYHIRVSRGTVYSTDNGGSLY